MKKLTEQDYRDAAQFLGCEIAAVKAVREVESNGAGFNADGTPKILFEGHKFYKLTKGRYGISNISYPKWVKTYYNENQHARLAKATLLDRDAALKSASWGMFQIMGENYKLAGFSTLQAFVNEMLKDERGHLMAFCNFVINTGLRDALRQKNWAKFAEGYNGKSYRVNKYDTRLAAAYNKYKG